MQILISYFIDYVSYIHKLGYMNSNHSPVPMCVCFNYFFFLTLWLSGLIFEYLGITPHMFFFLISTFIYITYE